MKTFKKIITLVVIIAVIGVGFFVSGHFFDISKIIGKGAHAENPSAIHSQYAGQETRGIKALSQDDIKGLLAGAGTPFGGMAKPAELNGYPGPRHVLDAIEADEFEVNDDQQKQIENLYNEMKAQAVTLGEKIIAIEQKIDDQFKNKTVTPKKLQNNIASSADLYKQLRFLHLKYHLQMLDVLTPKQIKQYNTLRGYIGKSDPCENIPKGHDAKLWKMHNNCD